MESIQHVSDTSFWIAAIRAEESKKNKPAFSDPYASKLSGEKGEIIMRDMPNIKTMAFAITIRTTAIDRLVEQALKDGCDTVINLGAGLDTRPYRMKLPATLHWIEVDFPAIIDYKTKILKDDTPVCNLIRISSDLSQEKERKKLFAQLGSETKKALVITEGVINYLTNEAAASLSKDIYDIPTFRYWIQNYRIGRLRNSGVKKLADKVKNTSPFLFTVKNAFRFFAQQGWKVKQNIGVIDEGQRLGLMLPAPFPWNILIKILPPLKKIANKAFGCVMFQK
jgi:methyltransferase (TIGR00027 family)